MISPRLTFYLLCVVLSASSACKTTDAYEATFVIAPPEALPDTTLVLTDKQSDDLPEALAAARGLAFAPPAMCPSDAECDALMEALEAEARAKGLKVVPWREALDQDAETLTFLGADVLVEVTDFEFFEGRFSDEGRVRVDLFEVKLPKKKAQATGTRPKRMRFVKDANGQLVSIKNAPPTTLKVESLKKTPLRDHKVAARVQDMCISHDLMRINNMIASTEVRLGFKVRAVSDRRVLWLYKGSATGSALTTGLPRHFSRAFTITTDHSGNVHGAFAMVGLLTGVVGVAAAIPSKGESLEMAEDGFDLADDAIENADRVPAPFCRVLDTDSEGPGYLQFSNPEDAAIRLRDLSLGDFFATLSKLKRIAPAPPAEAPQAAPVEEVPDQEAP